MTVSDKPTAPTETNAGLMFVADLTVERRKDPLGIDARQDAAVHLLRSVGAVSLRT